LHWWLSWPATIAGIVCADSVLYGVGYRWGPRLFEFRWVQRLMKPERRKRIEGRFNEHGMKILLTARLLPPLRTGVFMIAGAIRYPFWKFLIADGGYAIFGVGLFFFGSQWLIGWILEIGHTAIYIGAPILAGFLIYHYYRHLRARELRVCPTAPSGLVEAAPIPPGDTASTPPVSILEVPPPPPEPTNEQQPPPRDQSQPVSSPQSSVAGHQ